MLLVWNQYLITNRCNLCLAVAQPTVRCDGCRNRHCGPAPCSEHVHPRACSIPAIILKNLTFLTVNPCVVGVACRCYHQFVVLIFSCFFKLVVVCCLSWPIQLSQIATTRRRNGGQFCQKYNDNNNACNGVAFVCQSVSPIALLFITRTMLQLHI